MGERIEQGYRETLRALLRRRHPRRLEALVERLLARGKALARREGIAVPLALARVLDAVSAAVERRAPATASGPEPPCFLCDSNLGGLAHWLRAAGYAASFSAGADDGWLVEQALTSGAVLVSGDAGILRRRAVRTGAVRVVWVPSSLGRLEQLRMVARALGLALRDPRCMACGGALVAVAKGAVFERIPPRTARWKDEYFTCAGCGKLFWRGTHWGRIAERLARAF